MARKSIYNKIHQAYKERYGDEDKSDIEANSEEGIPLREIQNNTTICSSCDDQTEALYTCRECDGTLCKECNVAHSRFKINRHHNVTSLNAEPIIE